MTQKQVLALSVLLLIGLAAGLISCKHRFSAEARNHRVEIAIDYSEAQLAANAVPGKSGGIASALAALRQAGVTTVAIQEDTLQSLLANGVIAPPIARGPNTLLVFSPSFPGQQARVMQNLREKTNLVITPTGKNDLRVNAPWAQFAGAPVGLDDQAVRTVQSSGLLVAPRLFNFTGTTPANIAWELRQTQRQCQTSLGMGPLIFAGADVLGNRGLIKDTAADMRADRLTYGSVEFAKTIGDTELSTMASGRTVRVHSIGQTQLQTMTEQDAVDQFLLGARERNIRVCYVRLFTNGTTTNSNILPSNVAYIRQIAEGLRHVGLTVGGPHPAAHPYANNPLPGRKLRLAMSLAVASGVVWLICVFFGLTGRGFWIALGVSVLVGLLLAWPSAGMKPREILALLAALSFPTLGLLAFRLPRATSERRASPLKAGLRAVAAYTRMTMATLAGVILTVGFLSGRLFLLKVDEFLGVKLVLLVPIFLVIVFYALGLNALSRTAGWGERRLAASRAAARLWGQPITVGQVVVGIVLLAILVVLALRSGNDSGMAVSPLEMRFRALLGALLGVRPRTKEFLLGYPALFLALAFSAGGKFPRAIPFLLVLGTIGEASLMDTFCHLHTPLLISMIRATLGWVLGLIIGWIVYLFIEAVTARAARAPLPIQMREQEAIPT